MSSCPTEFCGEIESPRPLRATAGLVTLAGWCFQCGGAEPPAVRAIASLPTEFTFTRRARPDVAALHPTEPAAASSGFALTLSLSAGLHLVRFEARRADGTWLRFQTLTLCVHPPALLAVVDEPVTAGVLADRVNVGGWALRAGDPVNSLRLRYGHRDLPCRLGVRRTDVAARFPDEPAAASAGFETADCLVAGHGRARLRAELASGRIATVTTPLTISVAQDENHDPSLDLTAPRVGLAYVQRPRSSASHSAPPRPLNVLFILHGSFASNSALHVSALANEFAAVGHTCIVAVPHDLATLAHHDAPAFRGIDYAEATAGLSFPNGRGPDVIHAWTTREPVRRLATLLTDRHAARLVVHLEDNEQEILALSVGRPAAELARLPASELDSLVPAQLSHPHRAQEFLALADGVTVITESLLTFVPAGKPVLVVHPAADERYFFPRPRADAFRRVWDLQPNTTVLFYHGNVHAANAAEVRELYAAVLQLNRAGQPVTLIRTGLDQLDFLGELRPVVAPFVVELGQILHHRYLPTLMTLADIFVQPGRADAFNDYRFPSKLPEFFALGRPVILPRTNLGHTVRHGVDAYVLDHADAASIAAAVCELRADPALAAQLAAGAAAFSATHFSWRRSAGALANFYAALTA